MEGKTRAPNWKNEVTLRSVEMLGEYKRLEMLPGGHFDAYVTGFDASSRPALRWFREHLAP